MPSRIDRILGLYLAALYADSALKSQNGLKGDERFINPSAFEYLICATQHLTDHGTMQNLQQTLWVACTDAQWRINRRATPCGAVTVGLLRSHLGLPHAVRTSNFDEECLTEILCRILPLACIGNEYIPDEELQSAYIVSPTQRVSAAVRSFLDPFQYILCGASDDVVAGALYNSLCLHKPEAEDALLIDGAFWISGSSVEIAAACHRAMDAEHRLPGLTMLTAILFGARRGTCHHHGHTQDLADTNMVYALAHRLAVFSVHRANSSDLSA